MTATIPRLNTKDLGCLLLTTQATNHTQKKPRQLRFVCPIKKKFLRAKQMVEQKGNSVAEAAAAFS